MKKTIHHEEREEIIDIKSIAVSLATFAASLIACGTLNASGVGSGGLNVTNTAPPTSAIITLSDYPINSNAIITFTWPSNTFAAATAATLYALWQGTNSGSYYTNYSAGTNLSVTVSKLVDTNRYYFNLSATNNGVSLGFAGEVTSLLNSVYTAPLGLKVTVVAP